MDIIIATPSAQSLRKLWRRRRYQRLRTPSSIGTGTDTDTGCERSRSFRLGRPCRTRRRVSKLRLKLLASSPLKLLAKFHEAYVETMTRVARSVGNMYAMGAFGNGKLRIPKPHNSKSYNHQLVISCGGEQVDAKMVLEIYNKLAASKNLATVAF